MIAANSPRIAICFFGITRSLSHTISSIEENILAPCRASGETRIFAHFFDQKEIDNPRSGEKGALAPDEHQLLAPDWLEIEPPDLCLAECDFDGLKAHGDTWKDGFRSLRNLVHQLHSLDRATQSALSWNPDVVIFARPDLKYHDSLGRYLVRRSAVPRIQLPSWQHWGRGFNDRFAIAHQPAAAAAYGRRIALAHRFCHQQKQSLHAELLLRYALESAAIKTRLISARASRIRSDASQVKESFHHYQVERLLRLPQKLGRSHWPASLDERSPQRRGRK